MTHFKIFIIGRYCAPSKSFEIIGYYIYYTQNYFYCGKYMFGCDKFRGTRFEKSQTWLMFSALQLCRVIVQ